MFVYVSEDRTYDSYDLYHDTSCCNDTPPLYVRYWPRHPGWDKDPLRRTITMHQLLAMRPGLAFNEEYAKRI
jgi:hypothetical protein